jgi:glyoxylase-like metal-dependent hydrolase (beta-lactamase superfamily II)
LQALRSGDFAFYKKQEGRRYFDFSLQVAPEGVPMIAPLGGVEQFFVKSPTLCPAIYTNCFLIDGILVDPSPIDEGELKRLEFMLKDRWIRAIFITHFHGDHLKFADTLAKKLSVPILMSERCCYWLHQRKKQFDCSVVTTIADGEVVGHWQGQEIKVISIQGHSDDQLALYCLDMRWFIAGDLFQYGATVVISDEEGDMREYQNTLAKIIDLDPEVLFPSHGIGVGGTLPLQKNLRHTKMRTEQVRKLQAQGCSEEEMLEQIYGKSIPQKLQRYALKNIRSHLKLIGGEQ